MKKHFVTVAIALVMTVMCGVLGAQITATKPQNPNITPLGPHAQQPPGGHPVMTGTIYGFVYWDANITSHLGPSVCNALAITVAVASKSSYSPFGVVGTQSHLTSITTVHPPLTSVNTTSYDGCAYSYGNAPLGQNLYITLSLTQTVGTLTPAVVAQDPPVGPIQFSNASCSKLPPLTKATAGDLTGNWGSCQNVAYDVNFPLVKTGQLTVLSSSGASGGNQSGSRGALVQVKPGPTQAPLLVNPGPTNAPLLKTQSPTNQSRGTLSATNPRPIQQTAGTPGQLLPATPATGGTTQLKSTPEETAPTTGNSGSKVQLNPQPYPPKGAAVRSAVRATPVALTPPKQSQKITNPKLASQNAAIFVVLQKQSQLAAAEFAQMKLGIRPAGVQPGSAPSQTMAATGANGMLAPASTVQRVPSTGTVPPGTVSSSSTNRYGTLQPGMIPGVALQCGHNPTMRVLTISGGPHPAIFTQDTTNNFNFYTITGCSFGNAGPNTKAYIYYQGTFHEDFHIQQWSNNFIALNFDPNLTGVDDQKSVTLVIQREDGQQATNSGGQFYAARQTVHLSNIRQRYFSLNGFRPDQSTIKNWRPTYTSGSSASVKPNLPGLTAEVHWDATPDPNKTIVGGSDNYDLSHLHSSFVLQDAWMEWRDLSCPSGSQLETSNTNWSISWYGTSGVQVSWQGQMCNFPDFYTPMTESNYAIDVSVTGPRGLDPWTGKPGS